MKKDQLAVGLAILAIWIISLLFNKFFKFSLADIAVVGADRFIVTNFAHFRKGWLQIVELSMQSSFGSIVYYDGEQGKYLEKFAFFPFRSYRFPFSTIQQSLLLT